MWGIFILVRFGDRFVLTLDNFYVKIYYMKRLPIVALIGQTNAGKSSILNRMARKNIAIVAREEGTTRDNVVTRIDDSFMLVDTAGLKNPTDDFEASIQDQIQDAIESADVILVTLDSSKYFDYRDAKIAKDALKSRKPVMLVLNKCDLGESLPLTEFRALGIAPERTFYVSAMTGQGIASLKGAILAEPVFSSAGLGFSSTSYAGRPGEPSLRDEPLGAGRNIRALNPNQTFMHPRKTGLAARSRSVFFPLPSLSGDNGAMVAAAAHYEIESGVEPTDPYALNIYPRVSIEN